MANNVAEPTPIPAELNRIEGTLKAFFNYNQYQIIGEARKTLKTGEEDWTASSKYFSLRIDSKGERKSSGYVLEPPAFPGTKTSARDRSEVEQEQSARHPGPVCRRRSVAASGRD